MANRYANLVGSNKIKDEWQKINDGFDKVQQDVDQLQADLAQEIADREAAVEYVDQRVDNIIVGGGPDKDPELVDIRTVDPSYTPQRTINTAGDVTRDMQAQFVAHKADTLTRAINVKHPPSPLAAALGDGTTDDTEALSAIFDYCRDNKTPVFLPSGTYKISASLDVSGLEIFGVMGGYNNQSGTIIEGSGDHAILVQESVTADKMTYSIKNLGLRNGTLGLKMTYAVHCVIENVSVIECVDGIELGDPNILGTLWNNFRNCRVDVTGIALKVNGRDYSNANIFETCYFKGGEGAATVDSGGIGAVANQFINTEFAGPKLGLVLKRTRSISLTNCYFESEGPSIVLDGSNWDAYVENCSFSVLKNNNPSGANTFIWHKSGTARVTVVSGYVYIAAGGMYDNLSFIQSDATSLFFLTMMDPPEREVYASGFRLFSDGLPTNNSTIAHQSTYTPQWTTNGDQPDLGNGTLTGRYTLSGRLCTVQVELSAGTTTTFGTGQFQISLPIPASHRAQGIARIFDSGTGHFIALAEVNAGSSICVFYTNNSPNLVQHNSPMTWAANDALRFTITYEI